MKSTYRGTYEQSRERIIALLLLLQRAHSDHRPLTQEEILRELLVDEYPVTSKNPKKVRAYEGSDTATRQKFERDKARIRDFGFDIETVELPDGTIGYQIDPTSGYAPPLHFTPQEQRVVQLALGFCGFGNSGAFSVFNDVPAGDGGLEYCAYLTPIIRALHVQRSVSFEYQSSTRKLRHVDPLSLVTLDGATYLVARVTGTDEVKGYRLSRITSMPIVSSNPFTVGEATRELASSWQPLFQRSPTPIDVVVETNRAYADLLLRQYPDALDAQKGSGKVELGLTFDNPHAALRFALDGGERLRLKSPKSLLRELEGWLKGVNRGPVPDVADLKFSTRENNDVLGQTLQLLHAVYNADDGLRISELAARFSLDEAHVRVIMNRLSTLEPMAGVHEGTNRFPARVIKECDDWDDEEHDDSTFRAEFVDASEEPSAFMWRDLFELNIALREASRLFDDEAITSAIEKIETVVSSHLRVEHSREEQLLGDVGSALAHHEQIKITYASPDGAEASERCIEPREIKELNGHSYVRAFCTTRQAWRTFRIDRIVSIVAKSPVDEVRDPDPVTNWLTAVGDEGEPVVVVVQPVVRYLFEPLPGATWTSLDDGRFAFHFNVSDEAFLDRLMLLAGPYAVVATKKFDKAGRDLAARMLAQLK